MISKGADVSKQGVGIVMGRAIVDKKYRELLKRSPQSAFEGYELSGEERQAMAGIDHRALDKLAKSVDERLKSWYVAWAIDR
jgi:hypothetical protein